MRFIANESPKSQLTFLGVILQAWCIRLNYKQMLRNDNFLYQPQRWAEGK
jgi:hypothetical protein